MRFRNRGMERVGSNERKEIVQRDQSLYPEKVSEGIRDRSKQFGEMGGRKELSKIFHFSQQFSQDFLLFSSIFAGDLATTIAHRSTYSDRPIPVAKLPQNDGKL